MRGESNTNQARREKCMLIEEQRGRNATEMKNWFTSYQVISFKANLIQRAESHVSSFTVFTSFIIYHSQHKKFNLPFKVNVLEREYLNITDKHRREESAGLVWIHPKCRLYPESSSPLSAPRVYLSFALCQTDAPLFMADWERRRRI